MASSRSAILVRCSVEEARMIREEAKREQRTISAFVLMAVRNRIRGRQMIQQRLKVEQNPGKQP